MTVTRTYMRADNLNPPIARGVPRNHEKRLEPRPMRMKTIEDTDKVTSPPENAEDNNHAKAERKPQTHYTVQLLREMRRFQNCRCRGVTSENHRE